MSYFLKTIIDPVDAGGCWKARGRRLSGSNAPFVHGFQLEIGGNLVTLNDGTVLPGGDNPEVTDWLDCLYEYRFEYGDCGADPCPDEELYVFKVDNCCTECDNKTTTITQAGCIVYHNPQTGDTCQVQGFPQRQWQFSIDGVTWNDIPGATGLFYSADNNGFYRLLILNTTDGCPCISNVIELSCLVECVGNLVTSVAGCVFSLVSAPCSNGIWSLINAANNSVVATGAWTGVQVDVTLDFDGTFFFTVECSNGCVYTSGSQTFTGCSPVSCDCAAVLNQSNCVLFLTVTGCVGYQYIWQRLAPAGWTTVQIGGVQHTPTFNQQYRVLVNDLNNPECSVITNLVTISCVPNCNCQGAFITTSSCLMFINNTCAGYAWQWEQLINAVWVVVGGQVLSFQGVDGGTYRVRFTKAGCPPVATAQVTLSCPTPCNCEVLLTQGDSPCGIFVEFSQACSDNNCSYELQYDDGTGFIVVSSGLVPSSLGFFTLVACNFGNGTWRVVVTGTGCCVGVESNYLELDCCLPPCDCVANITLDNSVGMVLFQDCPGYDWVWQTSADMGVTWTNVAGFDNATILPFSALICSNGYRVVLSKAGCPDVITNFVPYICT
jgi:hypothetical protein